MTVSNALCTGTNCGVNFKGSEQSSIMPQNYPIDNARENFDDAMTALANAAKALINSKKSEVAKNEALTQEKVEAKLISMQNSRPINYEDLNKIGYGISGGDNILSSIKSDKLDPAIFRGKDTVVIGIKEEKDSYDCEKYTEYDRKGRPVASIQKITNHSFPKDPIYHAMFIKYDNNYSTSAQLTLYKNTMPQGELLSTHPKAALTVGHYI